MTSLNPPLSRGVSRRGSAVGLLNVDDENVYGDNATKYGKKKGSFLTRVKQNVGQKIEAAKTKKISIQSRSGHYSAEKECDSDEWESEDDFDDAAHQTTDVQPKNQNSASFEQSFDFPNAFGGSDGGGKSKQPLDLSQHSFFDDANDGSAQVAGQSATSASAKSSKAPRGHRRAASSDDAIIPQQKAEVSCERRKSNDNLLSRRLEDTNLTKIKYGEESSILQFDPMKMQKSLPSNDDSKKEEVIVEDEEEDPLSRSEQFTLDANGADKKRRGKVKKKVRRNNSLPSEKVLRRAQRRSATQPSTTTEDDPQNAGRLAPPTRKVRRTKSSDGTPFDMSDVVDGEKKPKKRNAMSPKRSSSSNHFKSAINSSSHHSKGIINSSSHHSKTKRTSSHKKKGDSMTKSKPTSPAQITQPSTLDVRF